MRNESFTERKLWERILLRTKVPVNESSRDKRTKITFPEKHSTGISYARLLLHDTSLREDSYRTGIADTPVCECGLDTESAEHFLLYCTQFEEARRKLQNIPDEISDSRSRKKRLQLSEALLLAPKNDLVSSEGKFIDKGSIV